MDLSTQHHYVGNLFPDPHGETGRFRLSSEQITFFEENGYVAGIPVLTGAQCDALCDELLRLADPAHPRNHLFYEFHTNESGDPNRILFHALGAWRIEPGFHDILWHPAITVPASQLLGGPVRFWHDQLFCKPAHHGGVVAWHQDYSYWTRTTPLQHLTVWIGLDNATRDNGCIHYVPGSHRWELLPVTGLAGDMDAIQTVLSEEQRAAFKPIPCELKRGEAVFHHPLIVHGSFENRSNRPRRAVVVNYTKDGTRSESDVPLLTGTTPIAKGQPLSGQFYPLVYAG